MARGGARIISGVCAGATALTSTLAWATPQVEREVWSLRASSIERSGSGWIARGEASLSGPRGLYVKAPRVELDEETVRALATEESPAALVGEGWTVEGKRIEVDLARARATVVELGARDHVKR